MVRNGLHEISREKHRPAAVLTISNRNPVSRTPAAARRPSRLSVEPGLRTPRWHATSGSPAVPNRHGPPNNAPLGEDRRRHRDLSLALRVVENIVVTNRGTSINSACQTVSRHHRPTFRPSPSSDPLARCARPLWRSPELRRPTRRVRDRDQHAPDRPPVPCVHSGRGRQQAPGSSHRQVGCVPTTLPVTSAASTRGWVPDGHDG